MYDPEHDSYPGALRRLLKLLIPISLGLVLPLGLLITILVLSRPAGHPPDAPTKAPPGALIFHDGFDARDRPWWGMSETKTYMYESRFVDGEFEIAVHKPDSVVWRLSAEDATLRLFDAEIEVEARLVEGPLPSGFGLVIRSQLHKDGFYWFGLGGDGHYWVDLMESGDWTPLAGGREPETIHQGLDATNLLRVVCEGDRFDYYVNDVLLTSVSDDTFASGFFGLAVSSLETSAVVRFDNLRVHTLTE